MGKLEGPYGWKDVAEDLNVVVVSPAAMGRREGALNASSKRWALNESTSSALARAVSPSCTWQSRIRKWCSVSSSSPRRQTARIQTGLRGTRISFTYVARALFPARPDGPQAFTEEPESNDQAAMRALFASVWEMRIGNHPQMAYLREHYLQEWHDKGVAGTVDPLIRVRQELIFSDTHVGDLHCLATP